MKTLSVKDNQTTDKSFEEIYVIIYANLEYNDYSYDMYGEVIHKSHYYPSEEEALVGYIPILKNFFGDLRVYEIYDLIITDGNIVIDTILTGGNSTISESEVSINEVIDSLIQLGDNKLIYDMFRSLLRIVKLGA